MKDVTGDLITPLHLVARSRRDADTRKFYDIVFIPGGFQCCKCKKIGATRSLGVVTFRSRLSRSLDPTYALFWRCSSESRAQRSAVDKQVGAARSTLWFLVLTGSPSARPGANWGTTTITASNSSLSRDWNHFPHTLG